MAGEYQLFQVGAAVAHTGESFAQIAQAGIAVAHTGDAAAPAQILSARLEVIRTVADRHSFDFIDASVESECFDGFNFQPSLGWDLITGASETFSEFGVVPGPIEIADRERNPYPAHIPFSNDEMPSFLDEQQRTIREQHNVTQAGDSTFDYGLLLKGTPDRQFTLGSLGRFYHDDYGLIHGRYVQFGDWVDNPTQGCPVGWLKDSPKVDWIVTNDFAKSDADLIAGFVCFATPPTKGTYGWMVVDGANPAPIAITGGILPAPDTPYVWSSTGRLEIGVAGKIAARRWGKAELPAISTGTIYIRIEGLSPQSFIDMVNDLLTPLAGSITAHETRLGAAENRLGILEGGSTTLGGQIAALTTRVAAEEKRRATDDKAIRDLISTTDYAGALTAGLNTVRAEYQDADDVIRASIAAVKYTAEAALAAAGGDFAGLTAEVAALTSAVGQHGLELNGIYFDVMTAPPTSGQSLVYNFVTGKFIPQDRKLATLIDVDYTTPPTNGQALVYDSTALKWKPGTVASGGSSTMRGALVGLSANLTGVNYSAGVNIPWNAESYDTDNIHDNVTNNTRLVVPAGVTKVRIGYDIQLLNVTGNTAIFAHVPKNGSGAYRGNPIRDEEVSHTVPRFGMWSPPIDVVAGDYFECNFSCSPDASVDITNDSWFAMQVVEQVASTSFQGALVKNTADLVAQNFSTTTSIPFAAEVYDYGGWHDTVTNNTRLTVPAGITKVRLKAGVQLKNVLANTDLYLNFSKNGVAFDGYMGAIADSSVTDPRLNIASPVLEVVPGDYFELRIGESGDTSIDVNYVGTWFSIEAVEQMAAGVNTKSFARISRNAAMSTVAGAQTILPLDTVFEDPDGVWNAGTNRFTAPRAGYYQITGRMRCNTNGSLSLYFSLNGVTQRGMGSDVPTTTAIGGSAIVKMNAGDYLQVLYFAGTVRAVTTGAFDTYAEFFGPL